MTTTTDPAATTQDPASADAAVGSPGGDAAALVAVRVMASVMTDAMAHQLAVAQKVCVRPLMRRVIDQATGQETRVAIPCGSTRESVCPSCADKARRLRMQQCAEGWHRTDEPVNDVSDPDSDATDDDHGQADPDGCEPGACESEFGSERRVRSTRRRQDAADLPRVPVEDRTVGHAFRTPDGREYRPSMFLTLTLPSYGKVRNGVPVDPDSYDYRRAALDALHFAKLVDRFWQNLRRCAGYKVQYFAAVEPQERLAPHLHAAVRGAIPRAIIRQVVAATYVQIWWPRFDHVIYEQRVPVWDGSNYCDPDTGAALTTWDQALEHAPGASDLDGPEAGEPAHVMRFGTQVDMAGIIAPSPDADRAVRYLTKYLAKSIAATYTHPDQTDDDDRTGRASQSELAYEAHIDRLHEQVRWLPCSEGCANWLRYGIQPRDAGPGLRAGWCASPAHDRENVGLGGRRVLVSRQWSGKTLRQHRADRATVVREALLNAGIVAPEVERMAASVTLPDGRPRFVWTDTKTDPRSYAMVILQSVAERAQWRAQYDAAKQMSPVNTEAATGDRGRADQGDDRPP